MKLFWTIVAAILAAKVIEFAAAMIVGVVTAALDAMNHDDETRRD
ncbi:MAG: hypothetical protein ACOX1H_07535 [Pseudoramibacter sp.]